MAALADILESATSRLAAALCLERREARLEAQILAARSLDVNRAWLVAHAHEGLTQDQTHAVETLINRREQGEPVAYILGEKEFYGRMFKVTPDVLIPRPETELLVEAALECLPKNRPAKILDLGTGSGCIAITLALERPSWQVTAVDISLLALKTAQMNAQILGANVHFFESDLFAALNGTLFDLIVSNPPYVADLDPHLTRGDLYHEPQIALASGPDGLDTLDRLIAQTSSHLKQRAWLVVEHGWDQQDKCHALMAQSGFMDIQTRHDLAGQPRITLGQRGEA